MKRGGDLGPFIEADAPIGAIGYAWSGCKCTENINTESGWVARRTADDKYCPKVDLTCDGESGDGSAVDVPEYTEEGGTGTGKALPGGLFPWGFTNILPSWVSDPIKKLLDSLLLIAIIVGVFFVLSKFLKK